MEKRFIVKNVVSDYGVFDTQYGDGERLECICSARANADLIADILNTDYSKPNVCTYYENELQQENKQLKEQLAEKDKQLEIYKNLERYDVGELLNENIKLRAKINTIRKQVCNEIKDFIQQNESPSFSQSLCGYWFISAKKLFEYIEQIEQAKEN